MAVVMERLRFCEPVPHVAVQVDQPPKPPTWQLMGQHWALHARVSV